MSRESKKTTNDRVRRNFSHTRILADLDERLKISLAGDTSPQMVAALREGFIKILVAEEIRGETEFDFLLNKVITLPTALKDKRVILFPGMPSDSRKALELRLGFAKQAARIFGEPILDENGMSGANAYAHDFSKVLSVPGIYPDKGGAYPTDNSWHRHELGLAKGWVDDGDKRLAECFFKLLFGVVESTPVRIPGQSQSVLPMMLYGRGYKKLNFLHAVNNLGDIIGLVREQDLETLQNQYDITFGYLQGERTQPDAAGKIRKVIPRSEAGKSKYKEIVIDNTVRLSGISEALTRHFASVRFRYVWGMCNTVNSIINCIGGSAREVYGKVYEFTFKHRSIDHMRSKMRMFDIGEDDGQYPRINDLPSVFLDVTSYDRAMFSGFLEIMVDEFKGTEMYDFIRRSVFCPLIVRSNDKDVDPEDVSIYKNGDPLNFNPDDHKNQGLLSGWGWVSDAGKWAAFVIFLIGVKAGLCEPNVRDMDLFLKGKHPELGCFNLGDDNVVFGRPGSFHKWVDYFKDNGYWKFDYEPGCRFIGHIFHNDGSGRYKISNDPVSAVTNILTPERSWQSKLRRFPAHGIFYKLRQLDADFAYEVIRVLKQVYLEVTGENFDMMISREMESEKEMMDVELSSGISLKWLLEHRGVNSSLREQMVSDILRDEGVVRWKYSAADFKEAFGVDIAAVEDRPPVSLSDKVLDKSGYVRVSTSSRFSNELSGGIFLHPSGDADIDEILKNNVKLYEAYLNE